jgi:hypothetical protein
MNQNVKRAESHNENSNQSQAFAAHNFDELDMTEPTQ